MAGASLKRVFDFILGEQDDSQEEYDEYVDYDDENEYNDGGEAEKPSLFSGINRNKKVVAMPQPQAIKMKISKPTNFDQATEIVDELKAKNAVVINLEYVSKDVARRIVDVVSGAVQALDGNIEKVSNSIFVVAPYNYDIVNELSREKAETNRIAASWIK